ncbi:peptidoglycan editing factor PgeF [candidate division CSSED10-310 bacterium]|uniref:Purine nucleoside phosphorylase n=1 Tax=candidate division CSSED10-310 bacterium TaxID=2855610 RepID=A0ABV6YY48_UNCC1
MNPLSKNLLAVSSEPELFQSQKFRSLPGVTHVITGRQGGSSQGKCSSLNIAFNGWDDSRNVRRNRQRIFTKLHVKPDQVFFQEQVHRDTISLVEEKWAATSALSEEAFIPQTDAMITVRPNIVLAAKAADCLLIALFDAHNPTVAIIHAGWRSTMLGLAVKTVKKMLTISGSEPQNLHAVFSPSAGPCCYEVGPELLAQAQQNQFVKPIHFVYKNDQSETGKRRLFFDLWAANRDQIRSTGVPSESIDNAEICTMCFHEHFFSYRHDGPEVGSHAMMIWLQDQ